MLIKVFFDMEEVEIKNKTYTGKNDNDTYLKEKLTCKTVLNFSPDLFV